MTDSLMTDSLMIIIITIIIITLIISGQPDGTNGRRGDDDDDDDDDDLKLFRSCKDSRLKITPSVSSGLWLSGKAWWASAPYN